VKQFGRELGVRYVLEGSVRRGGNRVRIAAQLIETETGAHLWADRFDGSLEDVFDLQDKVASSVAGVIEPASQTAETARSARLRTSDLSAYDLYLRASAMSSTYQLRQALWLLEEAIARDRYYGPALGLAAQCYQHLVANFYALIGTCSGRRRLTLDAELSMSRGTTLVFWPTPQWRLRFSAKTSMR
jgi:adenylate cyclase